MYTAKEVTLDWESFMGVVIPTHACGGGGGGWDSHMISADMHCVIASPNKVRIVRQYRAVASLAARLRDDVKRMRM